ncbi:putative membrane-associated kinase regulator 5 [Acorus calamus]|uniref:Membrane-associated kinase regulator 5 n=1 Tax=Acorus calamus TaxID=4465 RepID=A0AAV9FM19_ACOCL|nr:putative membrane-associated kinase regulator 5 [Acorus calamus]
METFSLLKYWRAAPSANARSTTTTTTTTVASTDDEADADEGPFFDLEFAVPDDEDEEGDEAGGGEDEGSDDDGTRGFGFTVSSEGGRTDPDPDLSLSPSDDLFFKGSLLDSSNNNNSSSNKSHQFPISLAKSATKFRVFMLGLKKPRPPPPPSPSAAAPEVTAAAEKSNPHQNGKFFTVKFKVGEVPVVSLFTRDHSSRSNRGHKHSPPEESATADDKRFAKDVMHKYLRMIKPLYVNASKRSAEKPRFSGDKHAEPAPEVVAKEATPAVVVDQNARSLKQVTLPARLRMVGKQLGKSRSASAAVAAAPCPGVVVRRRDDSLIEQQDGIRSAIAHCKRSFNASSSNGHETGSPLLRCKSESSSSSVG